jgi:hypothetical protein
MRLKIGGMKMTEELKHKEPSDLPSIIAEANWLQELNAQAGLAFFLAAHWDRLRDAITQSPAAPAQGEPTAWLETFYEEEGGKETKVWLVEPKPDESTLSIQPLYVGRPAEGEPASASDLVKIAAELHRAKWQFDLQDETRLTMSEARQLVIRAFEQMHRIGDMALKMRDAAKSQSPAASDADLIEALRPFAAVAAVDIGADEADGDLFQPINHHRAPRLTVGDLRRAASALARSQPGCDNKEPRG